MSGAASGARRRVLPLAIALLLGAMSPVGAQEVGRVFRDCGSCPEMLVVPSGSYTMGSPASEAYRLPDEGPLHRVTIGYSLAVGVYEVTFAEWDGCVDAGGCAGYRPEDEGWGRGSRPVINVSWEDAQEYVRWLSRETGEGYRLLSESEWEYVARAGTETERFWGESESGQCRYGNGRDAAALKDNPALPDNPDFTVLCNDGYAGTAQVGVYEANAFGLHDVLGNVWEWTQDCWNESYSGAPADGSVWRSGDCSLRVVRGGSWFNAPVILRSAYRGGYSPGGRSDSNGFRVVRTIKAQETVDISAAPTLTPDTVPPEVINQPEVQRALAREYPPTLRDAGIGGTVNVHVFIDEAGMAQKAMVAQTSGLTSLDEAALRVANVFRFTPALNLDKIVPVWIAIPITFQTR